MHVVYLYDYDDWAIHNVGKALIEPAARHGITVECVHETRWHDAPSRCDVLHFGYLWLARGDVDYRRHAPTLTVTLHDPMEVSNFRNRLDWPRLPTVRLDLRRFDRVSVISGEMQQLLRTRYAVAPYHTPTFPHDADAARAAGEAARRAREARVGSRSVRFTASVAGDAYEPWSEVRNRLRWWRAYLYDHRGRRSLRQLSSMFVRTRRKNVPWLRQLASRIDALPNAEADFRTHADHGPLPRADYLRRVAEADVYVCTSYMEGGPLPLMDAVLAGLAVLTTPVGQTTEWVRHGENGFFCRTVAEFERAARAYAADPALLARHQAASRALAVRRSFDFEPWRALLSGA